MGRVAGALPRQRASKSYDGKTGFYFIDRNFDIQHQAKLHEIFVVQIRLKTFHVDGTGVLLRFTDCEWFHSHRGPVQLQPLAGDATVAGVPVAEYHSDLV